MAKRQHQTGSLSSMIDAILDDAAEGRSIDNALQAACKAFGKSNVFGALLHANSGGSSATLHHLSKLLPWFPTLTYPAFAKAPHLADLFLMASCAGRAKILEALVETGEFDTADSLIARLRNQHDDDYADFLAFEAILIAKRNLDFEELRTLAKTISFCDKNIFLFGRLTEILAFEVLAIDLAGQIIQRKSTNLDPEIATSVNRYENALRQKHFTPSDPCLREFFGLDLLAALEGLRNTPATGLFTYRAVALAKEIHAVPDWHVRRAITSLLKHWLVLGRQCELEPFICVVSTLIELGQESAAIEFCSRVTVNSSKVVAFPQFKLLQKLLLACRDPEERRKISARLSEQLGLALEPNMRAMLNRFSEQEGSDRSNSIVSRVAAGPRIAVCISGQLRSFSHNWPMIRDRVIDPLCADCFISTWDTVGFSTGYQNGASRILQPEILQMLPLRFHSSPALLARFQTLAEALRGLLVPSAEVLHALEGITAYRIHNEAEFDRQAELTLGNLPPMERNSLKMFHTMWDSYQLADSFARESALSYDIVVRMRPDIIVNDFCADALRTIELKYDTVYVNHYHPMGVSDQFAFGQPKAMLAYMSMIEHINRSGSYKPFELGYGVGGERGVFDGLIEAGAFCRRSHIISYDLSSRMFPIREAGRLLLADIPEGDAELASVRRALQLSVEGSR